MQRRNSSGISSPRNINLTSERSLGEGSKASLPDAGEFVVVGPAGLLSDVDGVVLESRPVPALLSPLCNVRFI